MHPNPIFRTMPEAQALHLASARGFGQLSVNGPAGPLAAHIPFEMGAGVVHLHLARSNAIARAGLPLPALLAVTGPDAYISPDWYGADDQVPTWNYTAVHLRGTLEPLPPEALRPHLERMSALFEARLAPKPAWTMAKMSDDAVLRLTRMILPFRLMIDKVEATDKLGQNKTASQRLGAADGVDGSDVGMEPHQIAAMMRAI